MTSEIQYVEGSEAKVKFGKEDTGSRIVILGNSGFAREVFSMIQTLAINDSQVVFVDKSQEHLLVDGDLAILGMGSPPARASCFESLRDLFKFPILIHPSAVLGINVMIGAGTLIQSGVSITTQVKIGYGCLININASIGHDVVIGDCSVVNPGATVSGNVLIGKSVLIGANSTVLANVSIGDGARVGAGAVVTKDVKAGETVIGIPARPM
jgi:sugar O-acyltransferase (sialic acid O-acetyltransferase NeuD family)